MQQILAIQQQKQTIENQNIRASSPQTQNIPNTIIPPPNTLPHPVIDNQINQIPSITPSTNPPNPLSQLPPINNQVNAPPPPLISQEFNIPPINPNVPPPTLNTSNGMETIPFNQPPPGIPPIILPGVFPDFSKPPPGFPATVPPKPEPTAEELMPSVPYYDLPAGLMIPLIKVICDIFYDKNFISSRFKMK